MADAAPIATHAAPSTCEAGETCATLLPTPDAGVDAGATSEKRETASAPDELSKVTQPRSESAIAHQPSIEMRSIESNAASAKESSGSADSGVAAAGADEASNGLSQPRRGRTPSPRQSKPAGRRQSFRSHGLPSPRSELSKRLSKSFAGVNPLHLKPSASTADRHALYKAQMLATPVTTDVVREISKLHNIRTYFYWRRVVEDAMVVLAAIGLALMVATNEVTEATRTADIDSGACSDPLDCDVHDNTGAFLLKLATSVSTAALVVLVTWRLVIETRLKVLRGFYAPKTSCFMLHWKETGRWIAECVACAYHIPPGVDVTFINARVLSSTQGVRVHVNVLGVFMFIRCYLLLRLLRNHNGTYSPHSRFLGYLHGVRVNGANYSIKYMFRQMPLQWISYIFTLLMVVTTVALTIIERPGATNGVGVSSYLDGLWLTLITISTVGYGDLHPESYFGRFILLLGGVFGGAVITTMLTGVFISFVSMNDREEHVTVLFARQKWEEHMRRAAARLLQRAFRLKLGNRDGTAFARSKLELFQLKSQQIGAQNAIRSLRRKEPVRVDQRNVIDAMGTKLDMLVEMMHDLHDKLPRSKDDEHCDAGRTASVNYALSTSLKAVGGIM